jgi:DNA excision repair protein ERCC-4
VRDLATVQGLASQLLSFDPVTFLSKLEGLRLSEAGSSIWLYHEATHVIYEQVVTVA